MTLLSAGAALMVSLTGLVLPAAAPDTACRITDERLVEISGLVTDGGDGYVVVNDGADESSGRKVFFLNRKCGVTRTLSYPSRPRDTEDMARSADGTLWIGDIGDNGKNRDTIGVWRLAAGKKSPKLFRMSYPDGAHDAEALLVAPDGTPVVITKDPLTAGIYVPETPLESGETVKLRRAGDFAIPVTTTSNPYGFKGRLVVTGAALRSDGRRLAVRTYADAFEFDVPQGAGTGADALVKAITAGSVRTVALPDEPQGESIAYAADGTSLLTVSEVSGGDDGTDLTRYPLPDAPAVAPVAAPEPAPEPAKTTKPAPEAERPAAGAEGFPVGALVSGLTLTAAAGLISVMIARRRRPR